MKTVMLSDSHDGLDKGRFGIIFPNLKIQLKLYEGRFETKYWLNLIVNIIQNTINRKNMYKGGFEDERH